MPIQTDFDSVTIHMSQGPLGAEVALSKLKSLGTPALFKYEALSRVVPVTVDALGKCDVQVPISYVDTARKALEEQGMDSADTPEEG